MTMYELKNELEPMGVVVRYKDYVVAAEFVEGPKGKGYSLTVWAPQDISKEKEMGFASLLLDNVSEWENSFFATEGEALIQGCICCDAMAEQANY